MPAPTADSGLLTLAGLSSPPVWIGLAAALGSGLLIGIERERRKGRGVQREIAGVRTFGITALIGAAAQLTEQPWLIAAGALLVVALAAIGYWRSRSHDPGITTELSLFVTYVIGVTAMQHPQIAAGVAVVVTGLLAARSRLHRFSTQVLTTDEVHSALVLAGSALVILPMMPDHPLPAWAGIEPRSLWRLAVLLMALQAAGHVALRMAGPRLGLALSGLVSGFVSSTATIASMGARARQAPELRPACVAGALSSNIATILQLALVAVAVQPAVLPGIAINLLGAGAATLAAAGWSLVQARHINLPSESSGLVFSFRKSVGFALLLSGTAASVAWLNQSVGTTVAGLGAALAGFADVHAACASIFTLAGSGQSAAVVDVRLPMLLALSANSTSKLVASWFVGGAAYGWRVSAGLLAMLAGGWLPYWLS
jgi:uncharacterized membrane protein (DUF4010 family)